MEKKTPTVYVPPRDASNRYSKVMQPIVYRHLNGLEKVPYGTVETVNFNFGTANKFIALNNMAITFEAEYTIPASDPADTLMLNEAYFDRLIDGISVEYNGVHYATFTNLHEQRRYMYYVEGGNEETVMSDTGFPTTVASGKARNWVINTDITSASTTEEQKVTFFITIPLNLYSDMFLNQLFVKNHHMNIGVTFDTRNSYCRGAGSHNEQNYILKNFRLQYEDYNVLPEMKADYLKGITKANLYEKEFMYTVVSSTALVNFTNAEKEFTYSTQSLEYIGVGFPSTFTNGALAMVSSVQHCSIEVKGHEIIPGGLTDNHTWAWITQASANTLASKHSDLSLNQHSANSVYRLGDESATCENRIGLFRCGYLDEYGEIATGLDTTGSANIKVSFQGTISQNNATSMNVYLICRGKVIFDGTETKVIL